MELVSGVVDLDGTGQPVREFYCTASATIEGVAFAAGTVVTFRRTPLGVWGYLVLGSWTDVTGVTTTTTTTTAGTTTTTTTTTGGEGVSPTPGTLSSRSSVSTGFTLVVTGASDETALHATPYSYSADNGATWSGWVAAPTYVVSGVSGVVTCAHRVRDAAGNVSYGSSIGASTNSLFRNAPGPLSTPTYDGSGQAVHPSVVDFGTAWNGWRYWMAMTPYPFSNDDYENPSIIVSSNGLDWQVPAGLTNPLEPFPGGAGFNYDTELVYDPDTGRLLCYYGTPEGMVVRYSTDGITWSTKAAVGISGGDFSWSVVRRASGDWWMFSIKQNIPTNNAAEVWTRTSTDPLTGWSAPTTFVTANTDYWHCGALWDGTQFRMLASTTQVPNRIRALSSVNGTYWAEQASNTGVLNTVDAWAWDNKLYRACMIVKDASTFRVWYSGRTSGTEVWGIGYTELPRSSWPNDTVTSTTTTTTTTAGTTTTTTTTAGTTTTTTTAAPWQPDDLVDLELWLDASDTATITHDANAVSQWNDKSGNARHLTQATAANKPITNTDTLNSLNAMSFVSDDSLRTAIGAYEPTNFSIFAVVRSTTQVPGSAYIAVWPHHPTTWTNPWLRIAFIRNGATLSAGGTSSVNGSFVQNTAYIMGYTSSDAKLYIQGGVAATGTPPTLTYPNSVPIIIGANGQNTEGFAGIIGEILIVDGLISSTDREKVEGYLAHKWGLTAALGVGHPYKTTPP